MERFYSKVNAIVHNRNLLKDSIIVEEKAEAEQYKKALTFWESIVEYYHESSNNIDEVLNLYENEFEGCNSMQAKRRVERWVNLTLK